MNFKKIVERVNLHAGIQGIIASVEATDIQEYIAEAVRSAWVNLQLERNDWKFMWESAEFQTVLNNHEYTTEYITSGETHDVQRWVPDSFYRNDKQMKQASWKYYWNNPDEFKAQQNSLQYVINEYREPSVIIPSDVAGDTIRASYYRTPQELESNTDVPLLPSGFHYVIVWRALEDVASYLGNQSIYERHSWKADILENRLMRSQIPSVKIKRNPFYSQRINQYQGSYSNRG